MFERKTCSSFSVYFLWLLYLLIVINDNDYFSITIPYSRSSSSTYSKSGKTKYLYHSELNTKFFSGADE